MLLMLTSTMMAILYHSKNISPQKLSITLVMLSILTSMNSYFMSNSTFLPSILIISFSSGMMILFSYCSFMSSYEEKITNKKHSTMLMMSMITLSSMLLTIPTSMKTSSLEKTFLEIKPSLYLLLMMMVVIITMISINKSFFNPSKKMMESY